MSFLGGLAGETAKVVTQALIHPAAAAARLAGSETPALEVPWARGLSVFRQLLRFECVGVTEFGLVGECGCVVAWVFECVGECVCVSSRVRVCVPKPKYVCCEFVAAIMIALQSFLCLGTRRSAATLWVKA